jgi:hypothetical protein
MKTITANPSPAAGATLFEFAARLDAAAPAVAPAPAMAANVNQEMFAALRKEAENPARPEVPTGGRQEGSGSRPNFSMETIRAAVFQRTWKRKLEATEVFRPEF